MIITMLIVLPILILISVVSVIWDEIRAPAASRTPLRDVGGPRGRLDTIPCQAAHWPRPSPEFEPPVSGRGHHQDHYANDVAATISYDRVVVDINSRNQARVHRIKRLRENGKVM